MTVRVIAGWSNFFGLIGTVVKMADDHVMVVFPGDAQPLRFGWREVAALS